LGAVDYSFIVLPPTPDMPSGTPVAAFALNNLGQVAGYEIGSLKQLVPVVWTGGVPAKLDMPAGYQLTGIRSINAAGQVLGQAKQASTQASVGIRWTNGNPEAITGPAACSGQTTVINMNAAGHVLGETVGGSCLVNWVLRGGAIQTFPTPDPQHFGLVGMNDADHILGYIGPPNPYAPWEIYVIELGQPFIHYPFPAASGPAFGGPPNNLDEFTGLADQEGPSYRYLWTGPSTLVGLPPNNAVSMFFSNVNDGGVLLFDSARGDGPYSIQEGATVVDQVSTNADIYGNPVLNDGMQFLAGPSFAQTALFTPEFAGFPTNVTGQVRVSAGDIRFDPSTGRFTQEVTLTNQGSSAIEGAAFLVLDHLAPQVSVYGLTGTTVRTRPSGNPYVRVPPSFGPPGVQVTFELQFLNVDNQPIEWTPRVFAGSEGV
jgi:hypothetical protein